MPFLKVRSIPSAFANLGDGEALNKADALGVSIFQIASIADVRHPGAFPGYDLAYTPGPSADFDPCNYRGPYAGAAQAARAALAEIDAAEALGLELVAAGELREGDAVDLQAMPGFTQETFPGAEFELATLDGFEHETRNCTRLDFAEDSVGVSPTLKFWTRRAIPKGAHVLHAGRAGYVQSFQTWRELDGSGDYTRAVIWYDGEAAADPVAVRVDSLATLDAASPAAGGAQ